MICCVGLFLGLFLGEAISPGLGLILASVGFVLGLVGDLTVFRVLGKRGEERAMSPPCCPPLPSEKRRPVEEKPIDKQSTRHNIGDD